MAPKRCRVLEAPLLVRTAPLKRRVVDTAPMETSATSAARRERTLTVVKKSAPPAAAAATWPQTEEEEEKLVKSLDRVRGKGCAEESSGATSSDEEAAKGAHRNRVLELKRGAKRSRRYLAAAEMAESLGTSLLEQRLVSPLTWERC